MRYPTVIYIGGSLRHDLAAALHDACQAEGAALAWNEPPPPTLAALLDSIPTDAPLSLVHEGKLFGRFDELEAFCRRNSLSFLSYAEGTTGADPAFRWWYPTMATVIEAAPAFTGIRGPLTGELTAGLGGNATEEEQLAALYTIVDDHRRPDIPPLTLLTIAHPSGK